MDFFNEEIDKGFFGLLKFLFVVLVFLGGWGYALGEWGWFLGLAFGWIPAAIIAGIGFLVWPLVLAIGGIGLLLILFFVLKDSVT